MYLVSYIIFAVTNMSPFWTLILSKDVFIASTVDFYGQEYANTLATITPDWIAFAFIGMALLGGVIGGVFGQKVMKKHFEKVGIN